MSNKEWDINYVRKIAGLPLIESYEGDDDDEDPDVAIANSDKRQQSFERKNRKELKQAEAATKKADQPTKKADGPAAEKSGDEKAAAAAAEAKRRGKAPDPNSFNQHAKANAKSMTRGEFIKWAAEKHGKGKNYASTLFAKYNPKSSRGAEVKNECWILTHPQLQGYTLAENYEMNQLVWVDSGSHLDTLLFTTEAKAEEMKQYLSEWRGQKSTVEHIVIED